MSNSCPRILCTEDNPDTRDLLAFLLESEGFEVVCADSAADALELAKTQVFDLLLVDNWMPGLSGLALTEQVREFGLQTPIVFYSGAARDQDKEDARLAGAQGYLVKPVDIDDLIAEVTRVIAESKIVPSTQRVIR